MNKGDKMKLPIKKKYFDAITSGTKKEDYRSGHITFLCVETNEWITKKIKSVRILKKEDLPDELKDSDMFVDGEEILGFTFK